MAGGILRPVPVEREAIGQRLPTATPEVGVAPVTSVKPAPVDDMINRLERLDALQASGALTGGEFAAAKRHVLAAAESRA